MTMDVHARNHSEGHPPTPTVLLLRRVCLVLGPLLFLIMMLGLLGQGLTPAQRAVMGMLAWMGLWWLSECVPLSATALLPIVGLPLCGVSTVGAAAAPYADELIFVFLGGFVLGLALEACGLHRRLALSTLLLLGTGPRQMILGVMLASAVVSMFVSNTATTIMMLPLGMSIIKLVEDRAASGNGGEGWDRAGVKNFACAMLLGIAYAATIGGMGTPIGTPPNLVLRGFAERELQTSISFGQWMIVAMPIVVVLLFATWLVLVWLHPVKARQLQGGRVLLRGQLALLGRMSGVEWWVLSVFVVAGIGWVLRPQIVDWFNLTMTIGTGAQARTAATLTDAVVALSAALLLLCIPVYRGRGQRATPVLTWEQAEKLPWGVLLLFGGGLSMAQAIGSTGLDRLIAEQMHVLGGLPLLVLLVLLGVAITGLGEFASNTAVATLLFPLLAPAATSLGVDPLLLLMFAALCTSLGFVLPVATPPNAIVFATGRIGMGRMVRAGLIADVMGVLIVALVFGLAGRWLMGVAGL